MICNTHNKIGCYEDCLEVARKQSAIDLNCNSSDFEKSENVVVTSNYHPSARKYLVYPLVCNLVSYGTNIVASVDERYWKIVKDYIDKYKVEHCFLLLCMVQSRLSQECHKKQIPSCVG